MGVKADKAIATYRRMRAQPLWRLLASTTGPKRLGGALLHQPEDRRQKDLEIVPVCALH
jgi:hypothetical protein